MRAQPKPPHPVALVAVLVMGFSPMALWFVLNYLRPDLVQAMLDHQFGYVVSLAEFALVGAGTGLALYGLTAKGDRPGVQAALIVVAGLFFTLPAHLLVLFGPIVFAFMFGKLDG